MPRCRVMKRRVTHNNMGGTIIRATHLTVLTHNRGPDVSTMQVRVNGANSGAAVRHCLGRLSNNPRHARRITRPVSSRLTKLISHLTRHLGRRTRRPVSRTHRTFRRRHGALRARLSRTHRTGARLRRRCRVRDLTLARRSSTLRRAHSVLRARRAHGTKLGRTLTSFRLHLGSGSRRVRSLRSGRLRTHSTLRRCHGTIGRRHRRRRHQRRNRIRRVRVRLHRTRRDTLIHRSRVARLRHSGRHILARDHNALHRLDLLRRRLGRTGGHRSRLLRRTDHTSGRHALLRRHLHVTLLRDRTLGRGISRRTRVGRSLRVRLTGARTDLSRDRDVHLTTIITATPSTTGSSWPTANIHVIAGSSTTIKYAPVISSGSHLITPTFDTVTEP